MCGRAQFDGRAPPFRPPPQIKVPPMTQLSVEVLPTRTIYQFAAAGIHLALTFTTPALLDDLDILARPVTYVSWDVRSTDKLTHDVSIYFDCSGEWVVHRTEQPIGWGRYKVSDMEGLLVGSKEQAVLAKAGDNLAIDWCYLNLAVPDSPHPVTV